MIRKGFIVAIRIYQKIFSPDHGIFLHFFQMYRCRFYPSCSEYAVQALRQYGLTKGIMVSCKRIARCNPFCMGGYDPVKKVARDITLFPL